MAAAYRAVAELAATDLPANGRSLTLLLRDAARTVSFLAGALAAPGTDPVHERLARQWGRPEAADPIRRALVLLAEHELNASTFAARVTASTGAPLSAAVLAGLAALSGPLHGTASQSLAGLVEEARRLRPEAAALMASFAMPPHLAALAEAGERLSGEKPNIDFALTGLTAAFGLSDDAPLTIFALARSVGWLAHALEQVETGALIRPRAHYVGVEPPVG